MSGPLDIPSVRDPVEWDATVRAFREAHGYSPAGPRTPRQQHPIKLSPRESDALVQMSMRGLGYGRMCRVFERLFGRHISKSCARQHLIFRAAREEKELEKREVEKWSAKQTRL